MQKTDLLHLAQTFLTRSLKIKAGENVWLEYQGDEAFKLAEICQEVTQSVGAIPHLIDSSSATTNKTIPALSPAELDAYSATKLALMQKMQAYLRIGDDADLARLTLTDDQLAAHKRALHPMTEYRVNHTRWLVVRMPTTDFAQSLGMTPDAFDRFYLDACLLDYAFMSNAIRPLKELMESTDKVRLYAPAQDTDLSFSIKGIPAVPCIGERNIPDGECYTAPVKNSMNGTIKFGPSFYEGQHFPFIKLCIQDGKIIEATSENEERTEKLNSMLDTDEGARFFGEFALNFNPYILHPTGSILFDEKINGGIHLAAGNCYEAAPNGNKSAIHWDMVHIQRPDYGGGEIWFDGKLIRKDGLFVLPELENLNPENLKRPD